MKRLTALLLLVLLLCGCAQSAIPTTTTPAPSTTAPVPTTTVAPTTVPPATVPPTTVPPTTVPDTVSILDFLRIAAQPVGSTMYVWGGGWNEADTGAGIEAVTVGVSPQWAQFAAQQGSGYDMNDTRYQIHDGLDCSGYVGWAVYNVLETENGRPGYVMSSSKMAKTYADMGLGIYIPASEITDWQAGDIMSMQGHVWIVVGQCADGSVLFLHASPPGVMFSGTKKADGSESDATKLAEKIMKEHYPDWYARFPESARPHSYLTDSSAMRWSTDILSDYEGLRSMTAEEVASMIFG
jgi:cell wall-associated NlpC family hydrolase